MTYEEYESAFVERLRMPGVETSALPYVEALNDPRPCLRPSVFVMFNGSTFAAPDRLAVISQNETLNFEIFMKSKSRAGKNGVFTIADEIKSRLMGWKPPGASTPATLSSFGYVAGIQNNWQYMLTFSFERLTVQRNFEEPSSLIKEITHNAKN